MVGGVGGVACGGGRIKEESMRGGFLLVVEEGRKKEMKKNIRPIRERHVD